MHHPGPPRFLTVDETIELAPRDPMPGASFEWEIRSAPSGASYSLRGDGVVEFSADTPGRYRAVLSAPDGTHATMIRVYPSVRRSVEVEVPCHRFPSGDDVRPWIVGPPTDYVVGRDRAERRGDSFVYECELPPGRTNMAFVAEDHWDWVNLDLEGPDRPRIRLDGETTDDHVVVRAAVDSASEGVEDPEVEFFFDDRDPLDRSDVLIDGSTVRIPRETLGERTRIHAVANGRRESIADVLDIERTGGEIRTNRPGDPPQWITDATVYELYVPSFAGTPDPTFDDLIDRLDHLEELSVDCLWLTPVLEHAGAGHGYDIVDFERIDSGLGSTSDFKRFVDECHDRGIRVLFDLVINHAARSHPFARRALDGDDRYEQWFRWEDGEPQSYFGWDDIVNFDFSHLPTRRHLLDVVEQWAEYVDGFRADIAWKVPLGFWKEVRSIVKEQDPEFVMFDETIPFRAKYHEQAFGVHLGTEVCRTLRNFDPETITDDLPAAIDYRRTEGVPEDGAFLQFVENHDRDRYIATHGRRTQRVAGAALYTLPGAPLIYSGQAIGAKERRTPLEWDNVDEELLSFYRSLGNLRKSCSALRSGAFEPIEFESDAEAVCAFERSDDDWSVVVVLNFSDNAALVDLDAPVQRFDLLAEQPVVGDISGMDDPVIVDDAVVLPNLHRTLPRVLMVGWGYPPNIEGGLDIHVANLFEELQALGCDVDLVLPEEYAPDEPNVIPIDTGDGSLTERAAELAERVDAIASEYDIIHGHDWFGYESARLARERHDIEWIVTMHSLSGDRNRVPRQNQMELERRSVEEADAVIAVSDLLADQIEQQYGVTPYTVHNGFSSRETDGIDVKERLGIDGLMLLFVGRHAEQKGIEHLIYGFRRFLDETDRDATLVIGGEGHLTESLEQFTEILGISDRVRFVGYVPDSRLGDYYTSADVFVSAAVSEPFGLTLTEALEAGTHVVATESGVAEVVPDECFITIEPHSQSIADGLTEATRRDDVPEFDSRSWSQCAAEVSVLYQRLLADSSDERSGS